MDSQPSTSQTLAELVWIGGTGSDLHSKTKVLGSRPSSVSELPTWNIDSLPGPPGPAMLYPRRLIPDPFRGQHHIIVLCDCYCAPRTDNEELAARVHPTNNRFPCSRVMEAAAAADPMFAVEQQYQLLDSSSHWPLGEVARLLFGPLAKFAAPAGDV